jgi:hypothetical protein
MDDLRAFLPTKRKQVAAGVDGADDGIASDVQVFTSVTRGCQLLLTITITMSDHNGDEPRLLSQPHQQEDATMPTTTSLAALDIPSSDLDLGSIIAPSELDSPKQWAELDFEFPRREGS